MALRSPSVRSPVVLLRTSLMAALAAAALLSGCRQEKAPASAAAPAPAAAARSPEADEVVATIGERKVRLADIDRGIRTQLQQLEEETAKQRFQLRRQALEHYLEDQLLRGEAIRRGLVKAEGAERGQPDLEALLQAEVKSKLGTPSDEEVKRTFAESASQLPPGATLEQYRGQIVEYLQREQEGRLARELVAKLRTEAGVRVLFQAPRKQVEARGPARGPADAAVTIVAFSDFECPFCARSRKVVEEVMEAYPGQVRLVVRQFPLPFHPNARRAAEASLCADAQGRYWSFHDALFEHQKQLSEGQLLEQAKAVGLDEAEFASCLEKRSTAAQVDADVEAGSRAGVDGTPAFFVNGIALSGAVPLEDFRALIDEELRARR